MPSEHSCQNIQRNKQFCTCSYTDCPRHGICCECVQYHLKSQQLPQCYVKAGLHLK